MDSLELERSPLLDKRDVLDAFRSMTAPTATQAVASATMTLLGQSYEAGELLKAWGQFNNELSRERQSTVDRIIAEIVEVHDHAEIEKAISWVERVFEKHFVTEVICDGKPSPKNNLKGLDGFREFGQPGILISHGKQGRMWVTQIMEPWRWGVLHCDIFLREDLSDEQKIETWAMEAKSNNAPLTALLLKWLKARSLVLEE